MPSKRTRCVLGSSLAAELWFLHLLSRHGDFLRAGEASAFFVSGLGAALAFWTAAVCLPRGETYGASGRMGVLDRRSAPTAGHPAGSPGRRSLALPLGGSDPAPRVQSLRAPVRMRRPSCPCGTRIGQRSTTAILRRFIPRSPRHFSLAWRTAEIRSGSTSSFSVWSTSRVAECSGDCCSARAQRDRQPSGTRGTRSWSTRSRGARTSIA